jgi:hypothetical protein
MRYRPVDSSWGINPSPEELAIDAWLDHNELYVSLREPRDPIRRKPAVAKPVPAPEARP